MIKFWLMYWFSSVYYRWLSLTSSKQVASEFIEYFTFIMHLKDQVTFQLSMRNLAQIYHYLEKNLAAQRRE